jgi:hypothetical protein
MTCASCIYRDPCTNCRDHDVEPCADCKDYEDYEEEV